MSKVYAGWLEDSKIRKKSTSGGMFYALSEFVLSKGGVVCGAVLELSRAEPRVEHIFVDDLKDIYRLMGSKYVQSYMGDSFKVVKKELENGRIVLFSGTPCQVAGLKCFLNKDYSNLYTVDILCHGVPSPGIFTEYVKSMELQFGSKAIDLKFRKKKPSWTIYSMDIVFENGKQYIQDKYTDPYTVGFLSDLYIRKSCHKCSYTSLDRPGDITLADYWGYKSKSFKMRNNEKGISLIMVNSKKGSKIWDEVKSKLMYEERTIEESIKGNSSFRKPYPRNSQADKFWEDYKTNGWKSATKNFCVPKKLTFHTKFTFFVWRNWYLIPEFLKKR